MNRLNKKFVIISLIVIIILGIITGVLLVTKKNKVKDISGYNYRSKTSRTFTVNDLTDKEKELAGLDLDVKLEDKKLYTEEYKKYLEASDEEKKNSEVIPAKYEVPFETLDDIKGDLDKKDVIINTDDLEINPETNLPYKFNLRDKINIKVDNQGSYGLCWAFASLNALETHAALNNLGNYDFSEIHIDYLESDLMYGSREVHNGGNFNIFQDYINEFGVVSEEQAPYRDHTEEEYNKFVDMPKTIEVTETVNFPYMGKNMWYSEDPVEKERQIQEEQEKEKEFKLAVKEHIMKNGGLYASIVATDGINLYIPPEDDSKWPNHAITIVGWDDNYSKDNFTNWNGGNTPKQDGAYIAVNSWGEHFNDNGYFYISYEDKFVENNMSGIVSTSLDKTVRLSSITNPAIKNYITEKYGHLLLESNGEKYITKTLLGSVYELDLSGMGLTSLNNIDLFYNLYYLDASDNNITDLSPLNGMTNLGHLDLSNNNISNLSFFGSCDLPNLGYVDLGNNRISNLAYLSNILQNESMYVTIDVSGNKGVTGLADLLLQNKGHVELIASDCGISSIPDLTLAQNVLTLDLSKNSLSSGLEYLPEGINFLNLADNNFSDLSALEGKTVKMLDLSNNIITTLPAFKTSNYTSLYLSGNPIDDWSFLEKIEIVPEPIYDEYTEDEYYWDSNLINLEINSCDLSDISFLNNIKFDNINLELKNNNITNLDGLNDETINKISTIDLSGNKGITGLERLKKCSALYLQDCGISDLSEISKLEEVSSLDLSNNEIKDISKLSNLKKLDSLSLAGNKGLEGVLNINGLYLLNLEGCDIDDTFNFYNLADLSVVNLKNNPRLTQISTIVSQMYGYYICIYIDTVDYDDYAKTTKVDKYVDINGATIKVKAEAKDGQVDFSKQAIIKKYLMKHLADPRISFENATMTKKGYVVNLIDPTKNNMKIIIGSIYDEGGETVYDVDLGQDELEPEESPSPSPSASQSTNTTLPSTQPTNTENTNNGENTDDPVEPTGEVVEPSPTPTDNNTQTDNPTPTPVDPDPTD